jgi:putative Ca2+/H+ antiporter (TMEM165/GDT1 family)
VITLATRHPHRDVSLGESVGLAAATVVSVTVGYGAESVLGPYLLWVKFGGGIVLVAFGIREILKARAPVHEPAEGTPAGPHTSRQIRTVALGLTFLLEMGDNTQILTIVFVASTGNIELVYIAATAALVLVTAISSGGASYLQRHVPEQHFRMVLGVVLITVGLLTILFTAFPTLLPFAG